MTCGPPPRSEDVAAAEEQRMLDQGPAPADHPTPPGTSRWTDRVGPVHTTGDLQQRLVEPGDHPMSAAAVHDRGRCGQLIGFRTADGVWVWPSFQFSAVAGRLEPRRDVAALWALLPWEHADPLELIAWMTGPREGLDGLSPIAYLDAHGLDDALRRQAALIAARIQA